MANKARETLEKKVQNAIFQAAFFRWESAVVISLTVLLAVLATPLGGELISFLPAWAWLLGGAIAEAILVVSSLTDAEFGQRVAASVLQRKYHPERLRDKSLQRRINEALDYRSRIEGAIRERNSDSMIRHELLQTAGQIDEWLEHIYSLATRVDRYQQEQAIVQRDYNRAQSRIEELKVELVREDDSAVRKQIEVTIQGLERQIATLDKLENTIQRAELQLENTITSLGTIYSQTMLVDAKDIDSGRARRLRQEIGEEVDELNDVLLAMDEVYTEGAV